MTFIEYNLDSLPNISKVDLDNIRVNFIQEWSYSNQEFFFTWHRDYKDEPSNNNPYKNKNVIAITPKGGNSLPLRYYIYIPFIYAGVPIVICR